MLLLTLINNAELQWAKVCPSPKLYYPNLCTIFYLLPFVLISVPYIHLLGCGRLDPCSQPAGQTAFSGRNTECAIVAVSHS